eukprot:TRINITY_DN6359_c3_g1_i1.p1 TRINITY_DN6359_c3_g1~~TRINITY_DN6359_c3_g1_i1.p1  ORF type:complete len:347 (+),score=46.46 TRINITY_DN6359_c3_g1_i1:156-1196(+)
MHLPESLRKKPIDRDGSIASFIRVVSWCYYNGYTRTPTEQRAMDAATEAVLVRVATAVTAGLATGFLLSAFCSRRARLTRLAVRATVAVAVMRVSTRLVDYGAPCRTAVETLRNQPSPLGAAVRSASSRLPIPQGDLAQAIPRLRQQRALAVAQARVDAATLFDRGVVAQTLAHLRTRYHAHPWHTYLSGAVPSAAVLARQPMWEPPPVAAMDHLRRLMGHQTSVAAFGPSALAVERATTYRATVEAVVGSTKDYYSKYAAQQRNMIQRYGGLEQFRHFMKVYESIQAFRQKEVLARPRADEWRVWLDGTAAAARYPTFRWSAKSWAMIESRVTNVQQQYGHLHVH